MYIHQISIQDFKNIGAKQTFQFTNLQTNILGLNGLGKTTIIDAICWCLTGRMFNTSNQGWKPKELGDEMGLAYSKVKDSFFTKVELDLFVSKPQLDENNQPKNDPNNQPIHISRVSANGNNTTLYFNGVAQNQKTINQLLLNTYNLNLEHWFIYTNPDVLFNPDYTDQKTAGKLLFNAVCHTVKDQLQDLKDSLFNQYQQDLDFLQAQTKQEQSADNQSEELHHSLEWIIANDLLIETKKQFHQHEDNINDLIISLQSKIDSNNTMINTQNEVLLTKQGILDAYYTTIKTKPQYLAQQAQLDQIEMMLRQHLFVISETKQKMQPIQENYDKVNLWLNNFKNLVKTNPSPRSLRIALGLPVNELSEQEIQLKKQLNPITSLSLKPIKCFNCGQMYTPKMNFNQVNNQQINQLVHSHVQNTNSPIQAQPKVDDNSPFDIQPHLQTYINALIQWENQIKELNNQINTIQSQINALPYHDLNQIQTKRNQISEVLATISLGERTLNEVKQIKMNILKLEITNKYTLTLMNLAKQYVQDKLTIISNKLNSALKTGIVSLFKMQANGTIKEQISIIDKTSYASFSETNTANKIKLGVEICALLQQFNDVNYPIFIDEVGRLSSLSWLTVLPNQIIATQATKNTHLTINQLKEV